MTDHVPAAFRAETHALAAVLAGLPADAWARPTRCTPWLVRDVVGHVIVGLARVPPMLATPAAAAGEADTSATAYYRADYRYSAGANTDRVHTAQARAAAPELVADLVEAARATDEAYRQAAGARVVRTRHGDAMLLADFLTTRVVEVAVHGLDITDALDLPPCLTAAGAAHLPPALLGPDWHTLGWDPVTLLRKVTGRAEVLPEESDRLAHLGPDRLAFG
jgi:uncharacterized protein (TIGR03083 family)